VVSATRVELAMHRLQVFPVNVRVYLGGCYRTVSEHLLHSPQIGPAFEQVSREGVSQGVRADRFGDPNLAAILFEHLPEGHAGERSPPPIKKEYVARLLLRNTWPNVREVIADALDRLLPDGYQAFFVSFADDSHESFAKKKTPDINRNELAHPEAGCVRAF
jgi:hypothetical protein